MSDSPSPFIFVACVVVAAVGFLAYEDGRKSVGRDCDALQSFHLDGQAYACQVMKKATP